MPKKKKNESGAGKSEKPSGPRCIQCGSRKAVEKLVDTYHCTRCGAWFDDDPDEGGDFWADPSKRMERRGE